MGLLTKRDSTIRRNWFKEMAKLRGLPIQYRYVINQHDSIYNEITPELSDPIEMNAIYDSNPRIKTLKAIGWVSETNEDKPFIIYLPFDTEQISKKARVYIPQIDSVNSEELKEFEITSITTTIEFPDCYTCTIVPVFESSNEKLDYSKSNFNYINVDQNDRLM